mgnify:CR=1 FL=1
MNRRYSDIWYDYGDSIIIASAIVLCIFLLVFVIYGAYKEAEEWEIFKTTHECKIIGKKI